MIAENRMHSDSHAEQMYNFYFIMISIPFNHELSYFIIILTFPFCEQYRSYVGENISYHNFEQLTGFLTGSMAQVHNQ